MDASIPNGGKSNMRPLTDTERANMKAYEQFVDAERRRATRDMNRAMLAVAALIVLSIFIR